MIFAALGLLLFLCSIFPIIAHIQGRLKGYNVDYRMTILMFLIIGIILCLIDLSGISVIYYRFISIPLVNNILNLPWVG